MSDAPREPDSGPSEPEKKPESSDRADLIAIGIGCVVVIVMFIAIVLVAMSDR